MNAPRASVVGALVLWLWLLGLTIALALGWRALTERLAPSPTETPSPALHAVENRITALEKQQQTQAARSSVAAEQAKTLSELQDRLARLEQAPPPAPDMTDLDALRGELEQLKARAQRPRPVVSVRAPVQPSPPPVTETPFPFRVLSVESRAGQRSLSVAPLTQGALQADDVRVLLPGEALGAWRLEALEGHTAHFRAAEHTRRVSVPQ